MRKIINSNTRSTLIIYYYIYKMSKMKKVKSKKGHCMNDDYKNNPIITKMFK